VRRICSSPIWGVGFFLPCK